MIDPDYSDDFEGWSIGPIRNSSLVIFRPSVRISGKPRGDAEVLKGVPALFGRLPLMGFQLIGCI
jgi:hypothetical protein